MRIRTPDLLHAMNPGQSADLRLCGLTSKRATGSDAEQRRNTPASTHLLPSALPRTGIIELLLCPRTRYRIYDDRAAPGRPARARRAAPPPAGPPSRAIASLACASKASCRPSPKGRRPNSSGAPHPMPQPTAADLARHSDADMPQVTVLSSPKPTSASLRTSHFYQTGLPDHHWASRALPGDSSDS
jgi:hypothetical protein